MQSPLCLLSALLALSYATQCLASSWGFTDATVSVHDKGAGVGGGFKQDLVEHRPLVDNIALGSSDTLKIVLTIRDGKAPKRPHQASLLLRDFEKGLDISYPLNVKDNGKAKIDLVRSFHAERESLSNIGQTHKDLPSQFLRTLKPIQVDLVLASFGSSSGYEGHVFSLNIVRDRNIPLPATEKPLRYGKLPEIHHDFKQDPQSPYLISSLFFTGAVLATLVAISGTVGSLFRLAFMGINITGQWLHLGANINHVSNAFTSAPISHTLFFGSIVGVEGIFFLYYTSWNLFRTLPVLFFVGTVTVFSGSRALSEVQERRVTGLR